MLEWDTDSALCTSAGVLRVTPMLNVPFADTLKNMIPVQMFIMTRNPWVAKKKGVFFLTIMYSSLVFCFFLYSRVQVPFCSLFLFLFGTRAAGRLDVQFWMCCCHSARLRWENAVGLLKGYSDLINMSCLVCRLDEQEDAIVIQSSPELWVGWFNFWSVVFLLLLRKACFRKQW